MGDALYVKAIVDRHNGTDEVIPDGCARTIGSWFQSPGIGFRFAEFASNGSIHEDFEEHVISEIPAADSRDDETALKALLKYVKHHGERGPVEGWAHVWVR